MTSSVARLEAATLAIREFEVDGDRIDALSFAIGELEALAQASVGAVDNPTLAKVLNNLSIALRHRRLTDRAHVDDLDRAIALALRSVEISKPSDSWWASRVNNLGAALRDRYQDTGRILDLMSAVARQIEIIGIPSVPREHLPMFTNNAAQGSRELFEVTGDRRHLKTAVKLHHLAVDLARSCGVEGLPRILSNAGITARLSRPNVQGAHEAIALQTEAVALTPAGHVEHPGRVLSLAWSWKLLASAVEGSNADDAFEAALAYFDIAVSGHVDNPNLAGALLGRAGLREDRWRRNNVVADYEDAMADYEASVEAAGLSSPVTGIEPARAAGVLAASMGDAARAAMILRKGLELADSLLQRQILRADQRSWHRQVEDLVTICAVAVCEAEGPAEAASVVLRFYRREARTLDLVGQLTTAGPETSLSLRRQLFEWLQNNSGGELPSLPPSSGPLKSSVGTHSSRDEGTVVTLLASEIGGLLIVTEPEGRTRCRALTGLNSKDVRRRATALDRAYHRVREDPSSVDHELDRLAPWMYESFGAAIEELVPEGEAVCVLACGSLAQLPLVAANCPERSTAYPLLTRPVRLLSRETARPVPAPFRRGLVIVGDTDTDVRTTSPASASVTRIAEAEAEGLGLLCELRQVDGISQRSIGGLLDEADLIHFACHGVSHPSDAARSRILLGGDRSLNVGDFLLSPLNAAPLVFLASCDTGRPDATLPDQTFGLVEALLLAGARMVIAPSRPVSRLASVIVSTRLYHGMSIGQTPDQALADAQRWLIGATDREIRVWLAATTSALRSRNCPWSSLGWLGSLFGGQENSPSRALQESGLLSFAAWT